tara:strand:- start:1290 stop:1895 length:606 start_codon:yes stop_codon:yes gene_type:complete
MDPYKILGVNKNASQDEIKKAFRKKALEHHPDKGGNEEKFKQINEAYSMISDSGKRSQHDAMRDGRGFGFDFSSFGDMFGDVFGQRKRKRTDFKTTTDDEVVFDLRISLAQVKQGLKQRVVFDKNVSCGPCGGAGGSGKEDCVICSGSGILINQPNAYTFYQKTCDSCRGSGVTYTEVCNFCTGKGYERKRDVISFIIKQV